MTDKKKTGSDIEFDQLTPQEQEAYIPRGEYKKPEMLDQGNAPKGEPTGPVPVDDDSVGDPERPAADPGDPDKGAASKPGKKRTT